MAFKMGSKKRGGARPGAGRPSLTQKNSALHVKIAKQELETLGYFSKSMKINKSELINALISLYLSEDNKDIAFCSECGAPLILKPLLDDNEGETTTVCSQCRKEIKIIM